MKLFVYLVKQNFQIKVILPILGFSYVFRNARVDLVEKVVKQLKQEVGSGKRKRLGETTGESELISYEVALLGKSHVLSEKGRFK